MQVAEVALKKNLTVVRDKVFAQEELIHINYPQGPIFSGWHQQWVKTFMWLNIFRIALLKFKNPFTAFTNWKKLKLLRDQYRNQNSLTKYSHVDNKYFFNYNAPGWPSNAFNRYISHQLNGFSPEPKVSLHTLVFAITKKCGFQCEHCCEWDNLNKPEVLSKEDILQVVKQFQKLGISQVQLSGGEPLNRFDDIIYLLDHAGRGTDFWLYTTGYQLTLKKATSLRLHGLTGITISLDHHREAQHDEFRGKNGSWQRALLAAKYAKAAGLAVCFSICATKDFISTDNLMSYAEMAKNAGASFIQILEPKAVGHYANKPVELNEHHHKLLDLFFETMNYNSAFSEYPLVTYHGYYSRRSGCSGSGKDYLYVDTDGDVHNCPFCQRKLFSALDDEDTLLDFIKHMKTKGCGIYNADVPVK